MSLNPRSPLGAFFAFLALLWPERRHRRPAHYRPRHAAPEDSVLPDALMSDEEMVELRTGVRREVATYAAAIYDDTVPLDDLLSPRRDQPHVLGEELLDLWEMQQGVAA